MLTGDARKIYFQNLRGKSLDLYSLVAETHARFQTEKRTRTVRREWEDMTLDDVRRAHPKKKYFRMPELFNQPSLRYTVLPPPTVSKQRHHYRQVVECSSRHICLQSVVSEIRPYCSRGNCRLTGICSHSD